MSIHKKYWKLKKDNITICKDCEHRYICSDCRVFAINNKINGKSSKCLYNPYLAIWE